MRFLIKRTDLFDAQLLTIFEYLESSFSKKKQEEMFYEFQNLFENLSQFPHLGFIPKKESLASRKYRAIVFKQNIIFYKVNEEENIIFLEAIVNAKQNYLALL